MLAQAVADVVVYLQANLPGQCTARGVPVPAAWHLSLPVPTQVQQYPACIVDLDRGGIGGDQASEIEHVLIVAMLDRDQDSDVLGERLYDYVDAIVATLDNKRFGTVLSCTAERHDSSELLGVGQGRAVRMRWVEFRLLTVN
jgi:hypothetical protein